jgi:endonuclease YncB( thermonuclease family)
MQRFARLFSGPCACFTLTVSPPAVISRLPASTFLALLLAGTTFGQAPPAPGAAADPTPPELQQKRQQFMARALTGSRVLSEQFANALAALAKEAGANGDYELALKAQQRREGLANLYSSATDGSSISNVIVLRPSDARVNGSVNYDRSKDVLSAWKTMGSMASWDVSRIVPGSYDVILNYGVADLGDPPNRASLNAAPPDLTTGGDFEFFEDSSLSGAAANRRAGTVTTTGGWAEFSTMTLPAIQLTRSGTRLSLRISRAKGDGGVMHLKDIRLTPAKPVTAGTPAPTLDANGEPIPQVDELTKVKQDHVERLRQSLSPIALDYTGKLSSLAAGLAGNADAVEELQTEVRRVERLGENPRTLLQLRDRSRPASAALADGLHEIRDARYLAAPDNTGDKFMVTCNGESFPVRLLWVSCPLPAPSTGAEPINTASYFGITEEDSVAVGIMARDFTAEYLKDKSLRLLTRGFKDPQGVLLVTVNPEETGDFAGVLVDNGLAMVHQPTGKTRAAKLAEETSLTALRDREAAAKTRHIPPGAWSRSAETPNANPGT